MKHSDIGSSVKPPVLAPIVQKVDKSGTQYSEIKGILYTEQQMKSITDSLHKVLHKGKVVSVINTITVVDTFYIPRDVYTDTVLGLISAVDSTCDLVIKFAGNYRQRTGKFDLRLTPDKASYITTNKHHFLKRDELTTNVYHTNKLFTPTMGNAYSVRVPRIIAVIGPFVGLGYANSIVPVIGIGVTFNLISIRAK